MEKTKQNRNSSVELLRIIAMIMIVFSHFACYGNLEFSYTVFSVPRLWYNLIAMGGKIGAAIYVFISGYFLISDKENSPNIKKIIKLWGQLAFYSVSFLLILTVLGKTTLSINNILQAVFPVSFTTWWFASSYFILYLLHPFINRLLQKLDKKTYQNLLIILFVIWEIVPTIFNVPNQSSDFTWCVLIYSFSGYIRLYGLNPKLKCSHYALLSFILLATTYLSSFVFTVIGTKIPFVSEHTQYFYMEFSAAVFLSALFIFMTFLTMKISYQKWINTAASATFAVYLIHDYSIVREVLWNDIVNAPAYNDSLLLIPYSIAVALAIFICCIVIDLIRKNTVEKIFIILVSKYIDKIMNPMHKLIDYIRKAVFG